MTINSVHLYSEAIRTIRPRFDDFDMDFRVSGTFKVNMLCILMDHKCNTNGCWMSRLHYVMCEIIAHICYVQPNYFIDFACTDCWNVRCKPPAFACYLDFFSFSPKLFFSESCSAVWSACSHFHVHYANATVPNSLLFQRPNDPNVNYCDYSVSILINSRYSVSMIGLCSHLL